MKSGNNQRFLEPFVEIPSSIDVDEIKFKINIKYLRDTSYDLFNLRHFREFYIFIRNKFSRESIFSDI